MSTDILVWTVTRGGETARVVEDGRVAGDPGLVAHLEERLREPITVWRHGTVASAEGRERVPIELRPGDSRYVVARIRLLCGPERDCEIVECSWIGDEGGHGA